MNTIQLITDPIEERQLRVVFTRALDRWSHVVQQVTGDTTETILTSIEGTSEDNWPPSPPLQELSLHELGNVTAVLGVGMAGSGHWSISCSVDGAALKFELACLVKDPAALSSLSSDLILSSYRTEFDDSSSDDSPLLITPLSCDSEDPTWATERFEDDTILRLKPRLLSESPKIASRWAYSFSLHGS